MREHPPFTHATTGESYTGGEGLPAESLAEKKFDREAFSRNLRNWISIYVSRINGIETNSLIDTAIENELIRVIDKLSEHEAIPGRDVDGVNVTQDFTLELSRKFTLITGPTREGVSNDPSELKAQILDMAKNFSMNAEDIPPTVTLKTLPLVDIEGKNTRLANRMVAVMVQKLFAHPYFIGMEIDYLNSIVHNLNVNITKPLTSVTGEDPSIEELDAYMDLFVNDVITAIDRDVSQRNAMIQEREEAGVDADVEESTPAEVIRGLVAADHDFLMAVASSLKRKIGDQEAE